MAGRLRRLTAALRRDGLLHVIEVLRVANQRRRWFARIQRLPSLEELGASGPDVLRQRSACLLFPSLVEFPEKTVTELEKRFGKEILSEAELVADGRTSFLGLSTIGPNLRFDCDYRSGVRFDTSKRADRFDFFVEDGRDVKYPWELSRLSSLFSLGLAAITTRDQRHATAAKACLVAWQNANPLNHGINWAMPMEVAIRSFSLVAIAGLLRVTPCDADDPFWSNHFSLIAGHGRYLRENLEYFPNLTNHYIANCFGLICCGALFAETDEGRSWLVEGVARMERQLVRQVCTDGLHYERSLPYHGLVFEMFLLSAIIAERAGHSFGPGSLARLDAMAEATRGYLPGNGAPIPLFGDADDGRILRVLSRQDLYDHSWLPSMWDRKEDGTVISLQELLIHGPTRPAQADVAAVPKSRIYDDYGLAVLRSTEATCYLDCGPIGLHGNNDTLSIALHDGNGHPWIVDPGTGCYTADPALRNQLRSSSAHNGPVVDGREVAPFSGLWRVAEDRTAPEVITRDLGAGLATVADPHRVVARHHAWQKHGIVAERRVTLVGESMTVADRIGGERAARITTLFTFAPGLTVEKLSEHWQISGLDRAFTLELHTTEDLTLVEVEVSRSYGLLERAKALRLDLTRSIPCEIAYLWRFVPVQERSTEDA